MPEPEYEDLLSLDVEIEVTPEEAAVLICKCADFRAKATYWQGVAEERQKVIDALSKDRDLTISYLKDRLDRAEITGPEEGGE